ncbi:MAG TPA: PhzF family phenazine biosynthesis protein, partial [Gemmatimonadaceae bacterium]|nr:PhzF family phenazine biosynthesis protein [Gemmatimonadaceae bacterium]
MPRKYHITDVFTETPFGGNQLAVLPDAAGLNDDDMLAIAREFNFSETTFVFPPDDEKNTRKIRIFTPGGELPFAGHPTVGTAFVLAECGEIDLSGNETRIVLEEKVGPIAVLIRSKAGRPVFVQLTAAKPPVRGNEKYDRAQVAAILSLDPDDVISNDELTIEAVSVGVPFLFVPLRDLDAIARARVKVDLWEKT